MARSTVVKIGFVLDDGLDPPDGVQQYVLTLGRWFVKQGHDVHYLVGQTSRSDIPQVHSLAKNVKVSFNGNKMTIPLGVSVNRIRQILKDQQFDVLHVQMPYSPQFAGRVIAAADDSTAVIGTFHILPYGRLQAWGAKILKLLINKSLQRFDAIVAVSGAAQEFASKAMNIDSTIVPNAVDLVNFKAGKKIDKYDDSKQNIIFLGRLVERKGCMQLLKAYELLRNQGNANDTRLIIAGDGPDRTKIENFIKQNNLTDHVVMVGWLSEDEKPDYLKTADIAVMPSLSGESFGIVLVEAIASGAGVVVGGDNPGYRFVLNNESRVLVDPYNTQSFVDTLVKLLTDKQLKKTLNISQNKRITEFDVPIIGDKLLKIYKDKKANRPS